MVGSCSCATVFQASVVLASITEEHKSYLRADAVKIIMASPDHVQPPSRVRRPWSVRGL